MERVFVYGTLRKGAAQELRMAGGRWLGKATVRGRLYRIDWYPGLVMDSAAGEVAGDVFEVSGSLLAELDHYEGNEYRRVFVETRGDVVGFAWIWEWLGKTDEARRIRSGDWLGED